MGKEVIPEIEPSADDSTLAIRGQALAGGLAEQPTKWAPRPEKMTHGMNVFDVISGHPLQAVIDPRFYPWSAVVLLTIKFASGATGHGTGWFFAPSRIATAAHNLHHPQYGHALAMDVLAGWDGQAAAETFTVSGQLVAPSWAGKWFEDDDWAIIATDHPQTEPLGYFGFTAYDQGYPQGLKLFVSGFPGDGYGVIPDTARLSTNSQFWDSGYLAAVLPREVNYTISTAPGMSGAPVFNYAQNSGFAIAIHTQGKGATNRGRRIDSALAATLKSHWA